MLPINIDGTDVSGITIDGTDVTEVTVDGDVVFAPSAIPDSGVFRYEFEDDSDTTVAIDSWNNNDASLSGPSYVSTPTYTGSLALSRDDADDVISPGDVYQTPENAYSARLPFNWNTTQADAKPAILSAGTGSGNYTILIRYNTQDSLFEVFHEDVTLLTASKSLTDGTWYELVVTFDGSTVTIYVDGTQLNSGSVSAPTSTTSEWVIGERVDTDGDYLNGVVDDCRLYNKELTSTEVSDLYSTGSISG